MSHTLNSVPLCFRENQNQTQLRKKHSVISLGSLGVSFDQQNVLERFNFLSFHRVLWKGNGLAMFWVPTERPG